MVLIRSLPKNNDAAIIKEVVMSTAAERPKRTREEWIEVMKTGQLGHWGPDRGADYDSGWDELRIWRDLGLWKDGDRIVEIGSGNGRLAIPLTEFNVQYRGIEPMAECVNYCRQAFKPWSHIRFEHVDLYNDTYNPTGSVRPESFRFPI